MNSAQHIVLLFTKYPQPGRTKTRLIPAVGAVKAAAIQRQMAKAVLNCIVHYTTTSPCELMIYYDGGDRALMQQWLGHTYRYKKQAAHNLGARMALALAEQQHDYKTAIIVGSDCPAIDNTLLRQAFKTLISNNVVLGPTYDGGYYLIGVQTKTCSTHLDYLFSNIDWGSKEVLRQTITRIKQKKLSYHLLEKLHDIDTPEDLRYFNYYSDIK